MELRGLEPLAFWMQTTGAALLAVERCIRARLRMTAQDGRSVHGLLYFAAVCQAPGLRLSTHMGVGGGPPTEHPIPSSLGLPKTYQRLLETFVVGSKICQEVIDNRGN